MKVIGYIRVSTEEQANSGLGLESQEAKIRSFCQLYDLELVAVRQDSASGKSLKREGLQDALQALKSGQAEGLITAKLDRLTRSVKDLGALLEDYFGKFSLFVVAEQVDTRTAAGRLVLNLLTSVAQWERETIGERTKDALKAKRSRGEKTGGDVPFGYDLDPETGKLTENRSEQKAIRLIRDLKRKDYSLRAICRELETNGHRTKKGSLRWHPQSVKQILQKAA